MKNNTLRYFILMHFSFLIYCSYAVIGKFASGLEFLSFKFIAVYFGVFVILGIYAILWQQVLKHISLTTAIANKAVTIIWGMIFGLIFFKEAVSLKMLIGSLLILSGIFILSGDKE